MHLMCQLSIAAAKTSIDLSSAYFVPDDMTRQILANALQRGVTVRIITPGEIIDTDTVRAASRGTWGPLFKAGAKIYEHQPSMYHCKVMVVDNLRVSVGSANFDNRPFRPNDEATLNVYDTAFFQRQTVIFEADLKNSREVAFQAWTARPSKGKLVKRLLGQQLLQGLPTQARGVD